jgi:ribosomal protein S18 acetylase RimI-like enzyme
MKGMYSSTDSDGRVASLVYLFTSNRDEPTLITHIWTRPDIRGKGHAAELFNQVLADADRDNKILLLSVQPDSGMKALTYDQLVSWYRRRGFHYCGAHEDPTMIRYPQVENLSLSYEEN